MLIRCFHKQGLCASSSSTFNLKSLCRPGPPPKQGDERGSPKFVGNNSQCPKILCTDKSTRSQLFARSAYLRYIVRISSRPRIAFSSFSRRLVASLSNFATSISNPQSLTSCHFDISNSGTSSKGKSFHTSRTTSLVCGTFSPRNSSPSPYSPGPVLKNPMSTRRCSSFCSDSIYAIISFAVIVLMLFDCKNTHKLAKGKGN